MLDVANRLLHVANRVLHVPNRLLHVANKLLHVANRVLLQIKTEIQDGEMTAPSTVYREKLRASSAVQVAPRKQFLLFSTLLEATMIDKDLRDKNIHFEISIGMCQCFIRIRKQIPILSFKDEGGRSDTLKVGCHRELTTCIIIIEFYL